ncbi:ubiquitin-conjugating enzyme/RWD-like protein [Russula brevipes]|nr:ubiquitin-conjugating enzyme/RWD-like protein [Russula brevipes]
MATSGTTLKRIQREISDLKKEDLGDISVGPINDNPFLWKARIPGPQGSVYEGGVFDVEITLGHDYPCASFLHQHSARARENLRGSSQIFRSEGSISNPDISYEYSEKGNVCIDILKNNWSPALSIFKVVLSLSSLLTDPNPSDPLVPSIATEFLRKRSTHDQTARQWTELYARPPPPPPPLSPSVAPLNPPSASTNNASASANQNRASSKGKGRADRVAEPQTMDIDLTSEGIEVTSHPTRGSKKRKDVPSTDGVIDLSEEVVGASSTRSEKRRRAERLGDVIVIED